MAQALAQANAVNAKGVTPIEQDTATYQLNHSSAAPPGALQNGVAAFAQPFDTLANALIRTGNRVGLVSDPQAQAAMAYHPFGTPEQGRAGTAIFGGLGNAAALMGSGPFAAGTAAIQGAEGEREKLDARQAAGEQISGLRQATDVGGQAAINAALTYFMPGGGATKAIAGAAGKMANPLLNAARDVAIGAGAGATEQLAQQVGSNALSKYVGGDKNQELLEGADQATQAGMVFGGVGQAVHEAPGLLARLRERASLPTEQGENNHQQHGQGPEQKMEENHQAKASQPDDRKPVNEVNQSVHAEENRQEPAKTEEHPTRLDDEQALTDWYKKTNPNDQTGDLIRSMAPHVPYALADVPHEFAKPLNDQNGGDVDRAKVDALKGLSDEEHARLPPSILGPDGEVFDGTHRAIAAQEAGRSLRAYVPESLIGQHGIEAAGETKNVAEAGTNRAEREESNQPQPASNPQHASATEGNLLSRMRDVNGKKPKASAAEAQAMGLDDKQTAAYLADRNSVDLTHEQKQAQAEYRRTAPDWVKWNEAKAASPEGQRKAVARRLEAERSKAEADHDAREDEAIPGRFETEHQRLISEGAELDNKSESGSRYYTMPDGSKIRVADHAPNAATQDWIDRNDVEEIRVDRPFRGTALSSFMAGKPESLPQQGPRLRGGRRAGAMALPSHDDVYGPGSIYHEEVRPQLQKFTSAAGEIKEGLKNLFPVETGAGDEKAQNIFREKFNRTANAHAAAEDAFESARKGFDKMKPAERLDFQARMYAEEPAATPELQKIADAMHADTNEGRKALESLGHQAAKDWSDTWYNMLWKKDAKGAAELAAVTGNPNRPGKIEGKGSFLKGRSLGGFDEGLNRGLVPKYDNPVEMFLATKAERGKYIAGVKGMEQLVGNGQITRAKDRGSIPAGWEEVPSGAKGPLTNVLANGQHAAMLKGDGPLIAPEGVARILKNITTPSALGNKSAFRLLMDANNTLTQSMLGLSAFHIKKVSQELVNMSAARALDMKIAGDGDASKTALQSVISPFKAALNGGDIQKMMLGSMQPQTADQARVIDAMKTQFKARPDREYETQWGRKFQKALDQGGLQGMLRAGAHAPFVLNERLMQKSVFGFVQRAKLHMGSELVTDYLRKNPNATHDALVKETGKISDHLDNVLGLMNRDNLFWNRTARDLATLSTLSVGWNYGSARALGGGLVDLGKGLGSLAKGGKLSDVDTRRISYLATTGALTALTGAAITYMATGKPPQRLRDFVFPPSGAKDRDGHDVRLNTGFYTTDYYDFLHDPIGTLKAKGSPLIHAASDLLTNRDYKGDKVFDTDAPWYKMAGQIASYLGKSATPLSVQQLEDVIQGGGKSGKSPLMQAAGFAGVKTAPRSLSQSEAEIAAHQILQSHESVGGRTVREREASDLKGKLADEVREHNPDAQKDIQQAIAAGKMTGKDVAAMQKRAREPVGLAGLIKNSSLDARDLMEKVWPKMSAEERQANQWTIRGKIGRANLTPAEKQLFWKQVGKDVKP